MREPLAAGADVAGRGAMEHFGDRLLEISKLVQLGRLELDLASAEFGRALSRIRVWPLDLAVCPESTRLDFQSDPADELIAATSVIHHVPLLTPDRRILKSKLVPLA
jgi:PIN domain nuclease of toxin-antitoxin system